MIATDCDTLPVVGSTVVETVFIGCVALAPMQVATPVVVFTISLPLQVVSACTGCPFDVVTAPT